MIQNSPSRLHNSADTLAGLDTPCLIIDEQKMDANITRLRTRLDAAGVGFSPHLKTAKSMAIAKRLLTTVHDPAAVSTLREAEFFADQGLTKLTYAVGITPHKLSRVQALRSRGLDLTIILDSVEQAQAVAACSSIDNPIPVLIELDCDGHRSGVRPDNAELLLAIAQTLKPTALLRGVLTHAGESYAAKNTDQLVAAAENERLSSLKSADILRSKGYTCPVISVGSTPTAHFAPSYEGITEVRAGVFVFFDLVQTGLGVCNMEDIALSVLATVIGHQHDKGWTIIDAGWTALSGDRGTARQATDYGYGAVCDLSGRILPGLTVVEVNQEHGIVGLGQNFQGIAPKLPIGTRLRILPNHACATAEQHDRYHVLANEKIIAHWPRFRGW